MSNEFKKVRENILTTKYSKKILGNLSFRMCWNVGKMSSNSDQKNIFDLQGWIEKLYGVANILMSKYYK